MTTVTASPETPVTEWARRDAAHLMHPVTPPTDDRGRELIDGFAGLWCAAVGHGREEIIRAVTDQMETLDRECADRIVDILADSIGAMESVMLPRERG